MNKDQKQQNYFPSYFFMTVGSLYIRILWTSHPLLFYWKKKQIVATALIGISPCYGQAPSLTCPTPTSISPCYCTTSYYSNALNSNTTSFGISIQCDYQNLTDSRFNVILNKFLSSQIWSQAVFSIAARNNRLTKVPIQISKFPSLFLSI